ncbi:MAG: clostripain-related cysteine peptidase [Betaproteobacteria bacterium]
MRRRLRAAMYIAAASAASALIAGCFGGDSPRPGSVDGYVFKPAEYSAVAAATSVSPAQSAALVAEPGSVAVVGTVRNAKTKVSSGAVTVPGRAATTAAGSTRGSAPGLKVLPAGPRGAPAPAAPEGYEPCSGAVVRVTGSSGVAVTDAAGYFRKDGVSPGTQTVSVVYEPYRLDVKVLVRSGQVTTVNETYGNLLGKWTIMVYMCADNNLESAAIADMNELEEVGSTGEVNILVQIDRAKGFDTSNGDWTGTRRYYIKRDSNPPGSLGYDTIVSSLAPWDGNYDAGTEVNMADPAQLRDFVTWCVTHYPAQHHVLILWDHGDGWTIWRSPRVEPRAICVDSGGGELAALDVDQVRAALEGLPRLDIIGFDACLMQMIEVAYEMRGVADIAVGSEETEPEGGWDYSAAFAGLCADPYGTSAWDLARALVDSYLASYSAYPYWGVTQSAFRLEQVDDVAAAVKALRDELVRRIQANIAGTDASKIGQALSAARLEALQYWGCPHFDIADFAAKLRAHVADPASGVSAPAQEAICAKADALLAALSGPWLYAGGPEARAWGNGLSVYLPDRYSWSPYSKYDYLQFERDTHWSDIFTYIDPYPY